LSIAYGSVHGRKEITCDKCHKGDPSKADKRQSHKGVKKPGDSEGSVFYKNLSETCGFCHKEVYQEFIRCGHYQNLKADRLASTCTTCHGFQMDIQEIEPLRLAGRCTIMS